VRAGYLTGHGGNEVVAVGERPRPVRRAGEVLVRLHAATVNRVDLYMRDSGAGITHTLPMVMGLDGAGVVEEIDADERTLQAGQRVLLHPGIACGRCEFCLRGDDTLCTSMRLLGEHRDGTFA
jgi:NADPH:quinone reductase-like Zn-dependent oxidoreductase